MSDLLANKVHFVLRDPEVKIGRINKGERGETISMICETPRPFIPEKMLHNGAAIDFTRENALDLYRRLGKVLGIGLHLAALLLTIPASAQVCATTTVQVSDWSPCGQTITPADSPWAEVYGVTVDDLRMVDSYTSGGTFNLQCSVWMIVALDSARCPPINQRFPKTRQCP